MTVSMAPPGCAGVAMVVWWFLLGARFVRGLGSYGTTRLPLCLVWAAGKQVLEKGGTVERGTVENEELGTTATCGGFWPVLTGGSWHRGVSLATVLCLGCCSLPLHVYFICVLHVCVCA